MKVAIAPDDYTAIGNPDAYDAASGRWRQYLEAASCSVLTVDVRHPDILMHLRECDGFMWRWAHFGGMGRIAKRLLPTVELGLKLLTYPDQATCWHYDDKVAQAMLFNVLGVPTPKTWVFFSREVALNWLCKQPLPLVMKLANGAGSNNVVLVESRSQAQELIDQVFTSYVQSLQCPNTLSLRERSSIFYRNVLLGRPMNEPDTGYEPQSGYALFQEFLPDNPFDTRITVIGNRAFGFRRWNRAGDFRASGSGNIDYNPSEVHQSFIRLAFETANRLGMQSCAIDGMWRRGEPLVGEVSYTYVSGSVHDCPGRWELSGDPSTGSLQWVDGHMWPEEAQVEDFLVRLERRRT